MKRQLILLLILAFVSTQTWAQSSYVLFNKNSCILTTENKSRLDSLIAHVKNGKGIEEINLLGHTDNDASDDYNKKLSFKRAIAVKNYLITNGLKNPIHVDSKGESEPLNGNETEMEKMKNRRVEIRRNYSKNNFAFDYFDKEFQVYAVDTRKDTLLTCEFGAKIQLSKDIFQTTDVSNPVTIKVQEYYSKKEFVLSNLTTQDLNNDQLESRGMINIEAFQNDKKLELKPGKSIGILFKDRKINDNTEIFNGVTHDEQIAWDNTSDATGRVETHGSSTTRIGNTVLESRKWRYEVINGEKYKITEIFKDGKTIRDTVSEENEKLTNDLVLNSKKLGWINCDRFFKSNSPKIDLVVKYTGNFVPNLVVVFEDINSVLAYSYREDNKLIFKNVPADKDIVFIGLFKSKTSDKIMFAQKKTKSKDGLVETITFDELTADEVRQKVNVL